MASIKPAEGLADKLERFIQAYVAAPDGTSAVLDSARVIAECSTTDEAEQLKTIILGSLLVTAKERGVFTPEFGEAVVKTGTGAITAIAKVADALLEALGKPTVTTDPLQP